MQMQFYTRMQHPPALHAAHVRVIMQGGNSAFFFFTPFFFLMKVLKE